MRKTVVSTLFLAAAIAVTSTACGNQDTTAVDTSVAPLKTNQAVAVTNPNGLDLTKLPTPAVVTGPGLQFGLTGYGVVSAVTPQTVDANGHASHADAPVRAADGQKLLAFTYEGDGALAGSPAAGEQKFAGQVTVIADGTRIPLSTQTLQLKGMLPDFTEAAAVSVPKDAKNISLEIKTGDLTQHLSLVTGKRDTGDAPALYQRKNVGIGDDSETDDLPTVEVDTVAGGAMTFPYRTDGFSSTTDVVLARAVLHTQVTGTNGEVVRASDPTKAILTINGSGHDENPTSTYHAVLPAASFVLGLPDGTQIPAKRFDADYANQDVIGGVLYWEVPADLAGATLTVKPGTVTDTESGATVAYGHTPQTAKVSFTG